MCREPWWVTPPGGTLWECPDCGRWWKWKPGLFPDPNAFLNFHPVRWYDVPARRRIAAHETEKRATPARWWHCHPNPNRGQP